MKRKYLSILTISLLLIFFAGFLYYSWLKFNLLTVAESGGKVGEGTEPFSLLPMGEITNGEIFVSQESHFHFRYPQGWFINQPTSQSKSSSLGKILEIWSLSNFKPSSRQKKLPSEGIKIDFEVLSSSAKSLDEILSCEDEELLECQDVEINGITYRRVILKPSSETKSIILATLNNGLLYKATGYPAPGEGEEKAIEKIKAIMNTFRILK
ncbi:MAG TPA: hypothetical protein VMW25_01020 [Clostridia bacterium]|nr:hypothetical protein [Clostridia bacterium]